jgi:two-component system, OmpR family, response regulator
MMKRVLVADDTKNIRTLVAKCLEMEGYEVAEAFNGSQALDLLRSQSFSMAFLDIKMPGMSGTEVLKSIRAAGNNTPVIIITAYATVKNAVECTQLGAVAYLHKPFTADKLRNVLAELKYANTPAEAERLIQSGHPQEAALVLKKALADNPLDARIYRLLAETAEQLGRVEEAAKYQAICHSLANGHS